MDPILSRSLLPTVKVNLPEVTLSGPQPLPPMPSVTITGPGRGVPLTRKLRTRPARRSCQAPL